MIYSRQKITDDKNWSIGVKNYARPIVQLIFDNVTALIIVVIAEFMTVLSF